MNKKKVVALALASTMVLSLAACGNNGGKDEEKGGEATDVTIDQITLGEDYTDLEADLKFLTHKTDVVDTKFQDYIEEFQKMYPNINIE